MMGQKYLEGICLALMVLAGYGAFKIIEAFL